MSKYRIDEKLLAYNPDVESEAPEPKGEFRGIPLWKRLWVKIAPRNITLLTAGLYVAGVTCGTATFAAIVGALIGQYLPDYYFLVFKINDPDFSTVKLGAAMGLIQGGLAGLVTGLVLVVVVCWYQVRMAQAAATCRV